MSTPRLPRGFKAAGLACGVKDDPTVLDLAVFAADESCAAAAVFTQNRVCGAPVTVSKARVPTDSARAVVINSGNANACTGQQGLEDARAMTTQVADLLGCKPESVLVCSTGVIGRFLPMDKIKTGIGQIVEKLDSKPPAFEAAARAMMTTDTVCKQAVREVEIAGETICISGAAKGAAMIGPNMATMLSVIMTDAKLGAEELHIMLQNAVNQSFNCISVEGHTSTSDTVILMASGVVEVGPLSDSQRSGMQVAITEVAEELARSIISDAEGADHLITIEVGGLRNRDEAHQIAQTIANDALVKTAITGADPNWGRIVSCVGRTGVDVNQEHITLRINGTLIFEQGSPVAYDESELSAQMRAHRDVLLELEFPLGDAHVRFWTSDLTMEYVRLNSEYTT